METISASEDLSVKLTVNKDEKSRAQLSPLMNIAVGGGGGMIETYVQMPIITWKYCTQEGRKFPTTIPGWWRGGIVQSSSVAPITAFQVMVNGLLEKLVTGGRRDVTSIENIYTAMLAGAASGLIYCPADLMVIQQQKLNMSAPDAFRHLRGLYGNLFWTRGMLSTAGREAAYTSGYLGLAPVAFLTAREYINNEPLAMVCSGIFAGTIAAMVSHPLDTGKTVMQADIARKQYPTALAAIRSYYSMYGITSLYKGGFARVLRVVNACIIVAGIREMTVRYKTAQELD